MTMNTVTCSQCGADRSADANTIPRPPCPKCGSTSLSISVQVSEFLAVSDSITTTFTPGNQQRDWRQRWHQMERGLLDLLAPRTEPLDRQAVINKGHRIHSFFVESYNLKEALRKECPGHDVEAAISCDGDLGLVIDLANLEKHRGKLDVKKYPPRSGTEPGIETLKAESQSGGNGWNVHMVIKHGTRRLDGLDVAKKAVAAWRRWLASRRLIQAH